MQAEVHVVEEAPAGVILHAEHLFAGNLVGFLGVEVVHRLAHHLLHQGLGVDLTDGQGIHALAVAHDGHGVGDLEDLRQVVRDVDDGQTLRLQIADDAEQALNLLAGERGGGLVHDDDLGLGAQHLCDLHQLRVALADLGDVHGGIQMLQTHLPEQLLRLGDGLFLVDEQGVLLGKAADQQVFIDGDALCEAQLLIHHADAVLLGHVRRMEQALLAVDVDVAGVIAVQTGKNLHQRGLAGAVFAEQGVDLALLHTEIHLVDSERSRKTLGYAPHLQCIAFLAAGHCFRHMPSPFLIDGNSSRRFCDRSRFPVNSYMKSLRAS